MAQFGFLPAGARGYLAGEQIEQEKQARGMGSLQGLLQMQGALMQQDQMRKMGPLQLAQLQAQVDQAKQDAALMKLFMDYRFGGQPAPAGGPATIGQPAGVSQAPTSGVPTRSPTSLPLDVQIGLLHPRLQALAKEEAKFFTPTDKMRQLRAAGIEPGSPEWNTALTTEATQSGIWRLTSQGYQLDPNYAKGRGQVQEAEERARAEQDIVTIQMPDGSTQQMSRAEYLRGRQSPAPVTPTAPRQPGVGAGRSMTPEAKQFAETSGAQQGKLAAELTEVAQKSENNLATIDALRVAASEIKKAGGSTNAYAPMVKRATELVQGMGIDPASLNLPAEAGPYQVLEAFANKMALGLIGVPGGMPANLFSEADRKFVQASVARMADTEEGFKTKLDMFEKIYKRSIQAEQSWLKAKEDGKSYGQWRLNWSQFVNENRLFSIDPGKAVEDAKKSMTPKPSGWGIRRVP